MTRDTCWTSIPRLSRSVEINTRLEPVRKLRRISSRSFWDRPACWGKGRNMALHNTLYIYFIIHLTIETSMKDEYWKTRSLVLPLPTRWSLVCSSPSQATPLSRACCRRWWSSPRLPYRKYHTGYPISSPVMNKPNTRTFNVYIPNS